MFGCHSGEGEAVGKMSGADPALAELLLILVGAPEADPALPSMQVLCLIVRFGFVAFVHLKTVPLLHPTNRTGSPGIF